MERLRHRSFPSSPTNLVNNYFYVDSGACFHSTFNRSILFSYHEKITSGIPLPTTSFGGVGPSSVEVTDYGYLDHGNIKVDGVLLAPTSKVNLMSVGQIAQQYDVTTVIDSKGVIFKGLDGSKIGSGYTAGHHYIVYKFDPKSLYAHHPRFNPHMFGAFRYSQGQ